MQLRSIFTGLLFSSFLLCIASINLNQSAAAAKNLKTGRENLKIKLGKRLREVTIWTQSQKEEEPVKGGRVTDLESEDREQGLSEG